MFVMKYLEKLNSWVENAETALLVSVLSIMVIFAFAQVVLRNIFGEGILWGDIFLRHLVLWVGFLGASLATRQEKHINIDLFTRFLSQRGKDISRLITNLFSFLICVVLTDASWRFVQDEQLMGTTVFNDIPAWYFQIIIPVGFLLMALRFLILGTLNLQEIFSKKKGGVK